MSDLAVRREDPARDRRAVNSKIDIERPISNCLLITAAIAIAAFDVPVIRRGREQAFNEERAALG